jgi:carbamoyl-phosphate synthase large subunit
MNPNKKVLVTGIGGVVGQGIIRNIKEYSQNIKVIGVNITAISAGNYLCDNVYEVPFSDQPNYISAIKNIIEKEKIDLVIPSTDYEAFYLAKYKEELSIPVVASPSFVTALCLDKYKNYEAFSKEKIPFAFSILPSSYKNSLIKTLVKPREGRGSRNIFIDPANPNEFDDSYVIQEYLDGLEITTSFYVKKDGNLHGFITFERELEMGNTSKCEVISKYDSELKTLIKKMIKAFPFRGSCNIQCRVTSRGIIPFEINCRISGTNSVRSQFGFKDVQYTLEEYLFNVIPSPIQISLGSALRVIVDIIYPDKKLTDIKNNKDNFYIH